MAAAAASANDPKLRLCLAPLPTTRRGYGIQIYAHPTQPKCIYANGKLVIVRNLQNPAESWTFSEHKANVTVAQFSPSGFWVASGDDEGNVIIWSWPSMKVKNTVRVGKTILDLDWDADSARVVAVGDGAQNKAKVFTVDSGNNVGEILMHNLAIITCSYRKQRPFRIATGSEDLTVNYYEGPPFKYNNNFKGHSRYPNCVRFSPNGEYFLSVGADSKIFLFEGKTGQPVKEIDSGKDAHSGSILSFSWSPDSKQILTASADKTAKIINIPDGSVATTFVFGDEVNDQQVGALWHQEYLVTVSLSGAINYLDLKEPSKPLRVLHGHQTSIQSIAIDVKNGVFYTSGLTGEITQWNLKTGDGRWLSGIGHAGKVVSQIAVNANSELLYSFGLDDRVHVSQLSKLHVSQDGAELGGLPAAATTSPRDPQVAVAGLAQNKLVVIRGDVIAFTLSVSYQPTAIAFNVDGTQVIVGGKDKKLRVYALEGSTLKQLWEGGEHDKPISWIDTSRDGEFIVSTDKEASIYIRGASKFDCRNKNGWRYHQASVQTCSFSPDTKRLATGSLDTHIILWHNFKDFSADRIRIERAHPSGVEHVRFWDDNTLISVGADRTVKIWDVPSL